MLQSYCMTFDGHLRKRGYVVLGTHPRAGILDHSVLQQVQALLDPKFPAVAKPIQSLQQAAGT